MGIYKRGGIYYTRIKINGKWTPETCNTSDRITALAKLRERERRAADPAYAAAHETTLDAAAKLFLTSRTVKGCAEGTMHMYRVKLGHVCRILGVDTPLAAIDSTAVDRFCANRLAAGASRNTIGKELTALRGVLKVAKRAKKWRGDLDEVLPTEWQSDYEPRRTALTPAQVDDLVRHLAAPRAKRDRWGTVREEMGKERNCVNQAAMVAFMVATGARLGEAVRAERRQVDLAKGLVHFRITKTKRSGKGEKYVPVTPLTRGLLDHVLAATAGRTVGPMFDRWGNVTRDLEDACKAVGIPRVTPNDLRRTHSNWLRDAGVDNATIADVLGHMDSRMVDRVYGRLRPEQLRSRVLAATGPVEGTRH